MQLTICDACAIYPGLGTDAQAQFEAGLPIDASIKPVYTSSLPMMMQRRLSAGSKLALEVASRLMTPNVKALVFSSRHGEAARGEGLYTRLDGQDKLSPTDFMMSVHNAALGMFAIHAKATIPTSAIAAGSDSFHAGLFEAFCMMENPHDEIVVVDFESMLPATLKANLPSEHADMAYAVGLRLGGLQGVNMQCTASHQPQTHEVSEPISLTWYRHWVNQTPEFDTHGEAQCWHWSRQ